jgi:hypothetical protein
VEATQTPIAEPQLARPKWLSAVAVSAIVVGCLFGCCGLTSIAGLLANGQFATAMQPRMPDARMQQVQQRFAQRINEVQAKNRPVMLAGQLIALAHAVALAAAGYLCYRVRRSGRTLLLALFVAGIGVDVISGYLGLQAIRDQQSATAGMMSEMMDVTLHQGPKNAPRDPRIEQSMRKFMAGAQGIGTVIGWLSMIGFFVVKAIYYIASALYLRRPELVAYFERAAA